MAENPLEQFVLLAKTAKGAAAVELVKQALEAPGVYIFGELLDTPNIQELENTPATQPFYNLLQLFAFGTYKEYINMEVGKLPELGAVPLRKLRMLSVAALAETEKLLPYTTLQNELGLESVRDVEDLIIEGIACGVMSGKLDQKLKHFEVEFVIGRDIRQSEFPSIISVLSSWCENCDSMLSSIETQAEKLNDDKSNKIRQKMELETAMMDLKQTFKNSSVDGEDPDSRMDAERMDRRDKKGKKSIRAGTKGGFWQK
jgi:COP9 signalosome complex subunit 7